MSSENSKETDKKSDSHGGTQAGLLLTGTSRNDKLEGSSRNDTLDGGAGSDKIKAGSGNDLLIYTMSQNAGARDRYDGGSDTDTLRLNFTAAEWASAAVKADVARYLAVLAPVAGGKEGKHEKEDSERGEGWFSFKAFGLQVRNVENLQIYVNGVLTDPTAVTTVNQVPVITNAAGALVGAVTEDAALTTATGLLTATDADAGATLAWSVQGAAVGTYGSLALDSATGQWTYTLNNSAAAVQALGAGDLRTESFTVRVTDDKGASVDQVVVVTVRGTAEAPVLISGVVADGYLNNALVFSDANGNLAWDHEQFTDANGNGVYDGGEAFVDANADGLFTAEGFAVTDAQGNFSGLGGTGKIVSAPIKDAAGTILTIDNSTGLAFSQVMSAPAGSTVINPLTTLIAALVSSTATAGEIAAAQGVVTQALGITLAAGISLTTYDPLAVIAGTGTAAEKAEALGVQKVSAEVADVVSVLTAAIIGADPTATPATAQALVAAALSAAVAAPGANLDLSNGATLSALLIAATAGLSADAQSQIAANLAEISAALAASNLGIVQSADLAQVAALQTAAQSTLADHIESITANHVPVATTAPADLAGVVQEDIALVATGQLSVSDPDVGATQAWSVQGAAAGTYGSLAVDSLGKWTYTLDNAAHQALAQGETHIETFSVRATDDLGTFVDQTVTLTVRGSNDAPTGAATSALAAGTEDTAYTVTAAALLAGFSDIDGGATLSVSGLIASDGSVTSNANGSFTITPSANFNGAVILSYTVIDGNGGSIGAVQSYALAAVNDATVISGTTTGAVVEAGGLNNAITQTPKASGTLIATDVDNPTGFTAVVAPAAAGHGTYTVSAEGAWHYTLDNLDAAVQALNVGNSLGDSFVVTTLDGTQQVVSITINGTNDVAAITGEITGTVVEAGGVSNAITQTPTASGTLIATDVDNQTGFTEVVAPAAASYGTYTVSAEGAWHYTLDNIDAVVQALNVGTSLTDSFAVTLLDGTQQVVSIAINGSNDAAILSSADVSVSETNIPRVIVGTLTNIDVDNAQTFDVPSAPVTKVNGTLSMNSSGQWQYTALSAFDSLNVGQSVSDTFTIPAADGTKTTIRVTINGTNDAPVVTSAASASYAENATTRVYDVVATDVDTAGALLTYRLVAGGDSALFKFNSATGALGFIAPPDFEAPADSNGDNIYNVTVRAFDGTVLSAAKDVAITVTNVNDAPVITSGTAASFVENSTGVAYTAVATDQDAGSVLTYSMVGVDANFFTINSSTGVVSFIAPPDFENPHDQGFGSSVAHDNVYNIDVRASDGLLNAVGRSVAITVTNVIDAPVITSDGGSARPEGSWVPVYTATASAESGAVLNYSLGGVDAALFTIDASTGEVIFRIPPNFEAPTDADANNVYDFSVIANDGVRNSAPHAVAMTIYDLNEFPIITSPGTRLVTDNPLGSNVWDFSSTAVLGASLYTATATDEDAGSVLTFRFFGSSGMGNPGEPSTPFLVFNPTTHEVFMNGAIDWAPLAGNGIVISGTVAVSDGIIESYVRLNFAVL